MMLWIVPPRVMENMAGGLALRALRSILGYSVVTRAAVSLAEALPEVSAKAMTR